MVGAVINVKSVFFFFFNLPNDLVEADSKKKKIKPPENSEDGEPENHEAPAKGTATVLCSSALSRLGEKGKGWARRVDRALWMHGKESGAKPILQGVTSE